MEPLQQIWTDLGKPLREFIGRRVADPHVADDIAQDVMLKVQTRVDELPPEDRLPAWVFGIARNAVIDYYRARAVRDHEDVNSTALAVAEPDDEEQRQVLAEVAPCLARMIVQLPQPYREALELADMQGLSQQQLADRVGISLSGAKSRVQRGRQQLKSMLLACCTFERDARGQVIDYQPTERAVQYCDNRGPCESCE